MPRRRFPLVTDEIYHVYNRSVGSQPIYTNKKEYKRVIDVIEFYKYAGAALRFSHYNQLKWEDKQIFLEKLKAENKPQVVIIAFAVMPNHLHFVLKQLEPQGISTFMRNIQNSYAKYFNTKQDRTGAVFQSMFKYVRIETDEQLVHVVRYVHLNPLTSYVLREVKELESYPWSSFSHYVSEQKSGFVDCELILSFYKDKESFEKFTYDQVDYQRKLHEIKHLCLE